MASTFPQNAAGRPAVLSGGNDMDTTFRRSFGYPTTSNSNSASKSKTSAADQGRGRSVASSGVEEKKAKGHKKAVKAFNKLRSDTPWSTSSMRNPWC
jgi:hypothetical protein